MCIGVLISLWIFTVIKILAKILIFASLQSYSVTLARLSLKFQEADNWPNWQGRFSTFSKRPKICPTEFHCLKTFKAMKNIFSNGIFRQIDDWVAKFSCEIYNGHFKHTRISVFMCVQAFFFSVLGNLFIA